MLATGPASSSFAHLALRPLDVVRAFHARLETGRPLHGLVHEHFRRTGMPVGVRVEAHHSVDEVAAEARRRGFTFHMRRCESGSNGRVMATGVWSHDAPLGGSAGLFYAVYETLDGRILHLQFFEDEAPAREYAGLPPQSAAW